MKGLSQLPWWIPLALGLAGGLFFWKACPQEKLVHSAPEIITRWDTVTKIDTRWLERVHRVRDTVNLVREVLVQVPETVFVDTSGISEIGISALEAPLGRGDTLRIRGFTSSWYERGLITRWWETRHFVTGPIRSIVVDSLPPLVSFWKVEEPKKSTLKRWLIDKIIVSAISIGAYEIFVK